MNFSEHYFKESQQIDESILGAMWDLTKIGAKGIYKKLAEKPKEIKNVNEFVAKDRVTQTSDTLFNYMLNLTSADLLGWNKAKQGKGLVGKFIESKKKNYITNLKRGFIKPGTDAETEFQEAFGLSDSNQPIEISMYKTSNGGYITFVSVADPYEGKHLNPNQVEKVKDKLKNVKFYLSVDDKADKWFVDKTGKHYNQFLAARKNPSKDDLDNDLKVIAGDYGEDGAGDKTDKSDKKDTQKKEEPKKKSRFNWTGKIDKKDFNFFLSSNKEKSLKSRLGNEFGFSDKDDILLKSDEIEDARQYTLKNDGKVWIVLKKNGDAFIAANDSGHKVLAMKKIVDPENKEGTLVLQK